MQAHHTRPRAVVPVSSLAPSEATMIGVEGGVAVVRFRTLLDTVVRAGTEFAIPVEALSGEAARAVSNHLHGSYQTGMEVEFETTGEYVQAAGVLLHKVKDQDEKEEAERMANAARNVRSMR